MTQPGDAPDAAPTPRANPFLTLIIVLEVLLLAAVLVAPLAYDYYHRQRVYPGVQALGIELGGMTLDQARAALSQPVARREGQVLTLRYGERRWTASAAELGLRYDLEAAVEAAFAAGRGHGLLQDTLARIDLLRHPHTVDAIVQTDRVRALDYLYRLARDIDQTVQNASLTIDNLQAKAIEARTGYRLDVDGSAARVVQALSSGRTGEVDLIVATIMPTVTDKGIGDARALIDRLISAPVTVSFSGRDWTLAGSVPSPQPIERTWTVERQQLANAVVIEQRKSGDQVELTARFEPSKFTAFFTTIARELNRKAQDADFVYDIKSNRVTPVKISQDGRTVDVAENVKRLATAAGSDARAMQLAVTVTKPTLAVDQAASMGIKEQVSQGITTFAGSSEARAHNIRLAASKLDNAMIAPGATFSLLDRLGAITAEAGYQEGFAIVGESTVQDVGGGVCQVATTAFRAAFYAGLPIVERNPHRYLIPRYFIKGGPHGLDAAIYDPGRDLRFKNTTDSYMVIKTDASDAANFTVTIYGTRPGWTVTMEEPVIKPGATPGPRLPDIEDATKPVGYRVLAQSTVSGEIVSIVRVVKQGNTVLSRDTFNTTYYPASEQWIVGTKK